MSDKMPWITGARTYHREFVNPVHIRAGSLILNAYMCTYIDDIEKGFVGENEPAFAFVAANEQNEKLIKFLQAHGIVTDECNKAHGTYWYVYSTAKHWKKGHAAILGVLKFKRNASDGGVK